MRRSCCVHTSTRRFCDPLYRHRRVQAHQRLARPPDRRRIPARRFRSASWQSIGSEDFVARLGGDEFAIVQHNVDSEDDVNELIARIYAALRTPFDCRGHSLAADASIGIALAPRPWQRPARAAQERRSRDVCGQGRRPPHPPLLRTVDGDRSQRAPRARARSARPRSPRAASNCTTSRWSICGSNAVTGCEALLRWRHPVRGMVSPAEFHSGRGRDRADRGDRRLGAAHRLRGGRPPGPITSASPSTSRRCSSARRRCR